MKSGRSAADPVEEGAAVVEGELDARVALERLEHRQIGALVGLGDDPAEVADRLVVVERQCQSDPPRHTLSQGCRSPIALSVTIGDPGRGPSGTSDRSLWPLAHIDRLADSGPDRTNQKQSARIKP